VLNDTIFIYREQDALENKGQRNQNMLSIVLMAQCQQWFYIKVRRE
jgi:hypothetical protein